MPSPHPERVLVLTPDTVGPEMAGPGIRSVELARVLAEEHPVTLASPYPVARSLDPVRPAVFTDRASLEALVAGADVVVAMASLLHEHAWIGATPRASGRPLIVADSYDPVLFEVLALFAGDDPQVRRSAAADALARMVTPLAQADLVLCASERQRHLLLGLLAGLGRIGPENWDADPTLRSLVAVVPFGLPTEPPVPAEASRRPLKGPDGPFGPDDVVVLWGGGLHQWLDPVTLVEAMAELDDPRIKAYLLAGPHPTPAVGAMPVAARARRRATELGLSGGPGARVVFGDHWIPYDDRGQWLSDADLAVSLHPPGIEATFAYRTRLLDALWARLPIVCTEGDTLAELVAAEGLGAVVAPGDPAAVASAIVTLAEPRCYAAARLALGSLSPQYGWDRVAQPLVEFCRHPAPARDRISPPLADVSATRAQAARIGRTLGRQGRALAHRMAGLVDEARTRQREQK